MKNGIQCLGGPKNKQYVEGCGEAFDFIDGAGRLFEYKFDSVRYAYLCTTNEGPKFDIDFYTIPVPEFNVSKIIVECPLILFGQPDVRFATYELLLDWDKAELLGLDAITAYCLKMVLPLLEDEKASPRQWKDGERERAFESRQPPVTAEDVAEEAAQFEKGNDPDQI
jgi:hypothetical protein